eukprot:m51a1_g1417 hypothetical protein (417) ;mRNA; r:48993-50586
MAELSEGDVAEQGSPGALARSAPGYLSGASPQGTPKKRREHRRRPHPLQPLQTVECGAWFQFIAGCTETEFRHSRPAFVHRPDLDPVPWMPGCNLELAGPCGKCWRAGKMSVVSLEELGELAASAPEPERSPECLVHFQYSRDRSVRFRRLGVAGLQADPANAGAVFQAASNFNAGPAASVSAGPAAIARVHAAFFDAEGKTLPGAHIQTAEHQVEMLAGLREYFSVRNGYVAQTGAEKALPARGTPEYREVLGRARVCVHSGVDVVFGEISGGSFPVLQRPHTIDQVFCAAMNSGQGASGFRNARLPDRCERERFLLDAAYEGAYLAAVANRRRALFLTLVGGGVFGNPRQAIIDAIIDAHERCVVRGKPKGLAEVVVNMWDSPPGDAAIARLHELGVPVRVTSFRPNKTKVRDY